MNRLRLALWALLAWSLPAAMAGALGWRGIWGSGSAALDYLIPVPVAGGVLHLPSFALATLMVALSPRLGAGALLRWRAWWCGLALTGALATFEGPGLRLTQNPLGLFLLSDAVLALVWTMRAPQRPRLRADLWSLLLFLAPLVVLAWLSWSLSPRSRDFSAGTARPGANAHEVSIYVLTRLRTDTPQFRAAAEAWASTHQHPRQWHGIDQAALHFSQDPESARLGDSRGVLATLCQYRDGRAPRWLPGPGDCTDRPPGSADPGAPTAPVDPVGHKP